MKPEFALSLSAEGIVLLHRAAGGWRNVGTVSLDSADLTADLAALKAKGDALAPEGLCKLIIPNEQIRYLTIETGISDLESRRRLARAALEGATLMLLSREMRGIVEEMVRRVEHVELESIPDFFDIFVEGCLFKPMNTTIA